MTPLDGVRALLGGARQVASEDDALLMVCVPASATPLEPRFGDLFWASRELSLVGSGSAATIHARGPERFSMIRARAEQLFRRLRVVALGSGAPAPRLFGGFSFSNEAPSEPWRGFDAASFVLPRIAHVDDGGQHWVCRALSVQELANPELREAALDEIVRALEPARTQLETCRTSIPPSARDRAFVELVGAIQERIASGELDKVVAARCRTVALERPLALSELLSTLADRAKGAIRFAFRRSGGVFLGATPERLVQKRAAHVWSDALAGSCRAGAEAALRALRASDKERAEHAIVRDDIVRRLSELGQVAYPSEPELLELRHVAHLRTPIRARVAPECHLLEIAERLHPSPAVGGHPRAEALAFLSTHEKIERGWYAAPVGWFDAQGDGELAVALRSGLFEDARAHLYAGAGIVRGSDAESELAETELKLSSLADAIAGGAA